MNEELHIILCAKCKQPSQAAISEYGEVMVLCTKCGIATPADFLQFCHRAGIRIAAIDAQQS